MKLYLTIEDDDDYGSAWILVDIKKPDGHSVGLEVYNGRYIPNWTKSSKHGMWNARLLRRMKKWENR